MSSNENEQSGSDRLFFHLFSPPHVVSSQIRAAKGCVSISFTRDVVIRRAASFSIDYLATTENITTNATASSTTSTTSVADLTCACFVWAHFWTTQESCLGLRRPAHCPERNLIK